MVQSDSRNARGSGSALPRQASMKWGGAEPQDSSAKKGSVARQDSFVKRGGAAGAEQAETPGDSSPPGRQGAARRRRQGEGSPTGMGNYRMGEWGAAERTIMGDADEPAE